MAAPAPPPVPNDDDAPAMPQRATAATIAGFIVVVAALSASPNVPDDLRPLRLDSPQARHGLLTKVFARPKLTLAEHERAMEGEDKIVAEADEATEEKDLHDESRAAADLAALPAAQPAAESEGEGDAAVVAVDRAAMLGSVTNADSARLREQQRALGMPGTELRNPCLERTGSDDSACVRTALDPFFSTLDAIARGDDDAFARVVVLGNSLIASDHVTDIVRDRLLDVFGSAGRGFLLTERLAKGVGRRVRTGQGSDGWITRSFAQDPPWAPGVRFGFSGALHEASTNGEWTRWRADGTHTARLFWLDTGAGIVVDVDGKPWLKIPAGQGTGVGKSAEIRLPPLSQAVRLVADKGARIFGIAFDSGGRGVTLDTIGVPAASSRLFTELVDEQLFRDQLTARDPALTVIMLGGNETRGLAFGTIDEPTITARLTTLIERVRQAAPTSACLLVTPIDAGKVTTGDDTLVTRPEIHKVIAIQQQVAVDMGCGFFDLFAAMGGAGSLQKMRDAKLISDDLVHPNAKGGDVLGQLVADGLLSSWRDTPPTTAPLAHRRVQQEAGRPRFVGLSFPAEQQAKPVTLGEDVIDDDTARPPPLSRFFARLASLEQGSTRRVAIGQFGASHTAGQSLTDRMRNRLAQRFGLAGRGFVAVGKSSKRLQPSGVVRDIVGAFEFADGREVVSGGALGMSGTKTRLLPGAKAVVGFCQNCGPTAGDDQGTVQLAWLYTPDMGTADVFIDGERRATLSPNSRRRDSDMQFLSLPVAHERALVEVVARNEAEPSSQSPDGLSPVGPVHVLSVVEEMHRPGVVLDSIGLPGTTGMTPQRWRQDLYGEEVRSRRYDLIITAWGTNEAGIGSLDAATYKHHFGNTLSTLQAAAPEADCLIVGASDRLDNKNGVLIPAAAHELVERVQQDLAVEHGCAFFSMRQAMGGPLSMKRWVKDGLGLDDHVHFTQEGYDRLGDMIIDDLLAAWRWRQEQARATAKTAVATPPPAEAAHAVP